MDIWSQMGTCAEPERVAPLPDASCVSEQLWARAKPTVMLIGANGSLVSTMRPPADLGAGADPADPHEYASLLCVDSSSTPPLAESLGWRLLNLVDFVAAKAAPNCSVVVALAAERGFTSSSPQNC